MDDATILPSNRPNDDSIVHAVGDLIDNRYTVIRELGRGGMGVVYEVDDTLVSERLALKRLLPNQLDPDSVTAFIQAGNASRKFSGRSKRFVSTHTLGKDAFGPYLVLELVTAPTLRTLMQDGSIASLDLATTILRDIAQGLADLHEEGYVHRDIKPDNIFVQDGGNVLLADFGISKDMASSAGTMLPGALSRNYGSPEQAKGLPTTQASDIYAFGAVAYELFSGDAPYGAIEPLTELVPGIEQGISDLVMRCLAQRPERRPQNGAELVAALSDSTSIQNTTQSVEPIQPTAVQNNSTFDVLPAPQPVQPIVQNAGTVTVTQRWQDKYPALADYLAEMCFFEGDTITIGRETLLDYPFVSIGYDDVQTFPDAPRHVSVPTFFIGKRCVSNDLWFEYEESINHGWVHSWTHPDYPVTDISWIDIMSNAFGHVGFCSWVSDITGKNCSLPTNAQWEMAARDGNTGDTFPWGTHYDHSKLWASGTFRKLKHPSSVYRNDRIHYNKNGVSDMVGNVGEWCFDSVNDSGFANGQLTNRVIKGGSFVLSESKLFQCGTFLHLEAFTRTNTIGFRFAHSE